MKQRYSKYKDSGIEWIGEIPEHWEVRKIKHLFKEVNERSKDGIEDLLSVSQYSGVTKKVDRIDDGDLLTNASTLEGYKIVKKKQLVSNIMLAWNGSLAFSEFDGITSPAYCIYEIVGNNYYKYFHYLFKTEKYRAEFKRNSSGVIESRLRLYTENFFSIPTVLPPRLEQQSIAQFLDEKCARIDEAVRIKEKQINLLKEYRQIAIHQAVTKGLNDQVEMKDSGIDWVGEIPEHWEVKRLKFICYLKSGESINAEDFVDDGYPVFGGNGFRGFANTFTNCGRHILIGRQGALCGNVNYADGKFFASEHAIVVYLLNNEEITWLGETIRIANFNRLSQSAAQPGISVYVIKNVSFPYPPKNEQQKISEFIESLTAKTDEAIRLKEKQIEQLKQYKTSLINDVVTGKVRVA